ncbi:DUF418 domain-containing protein [Microbacterium sp. W4I20]|uniref:DUF418 domain-containing protein n=1 Tax=Microbacterium sp. W4I20 TaxID=3042262 RepID=UPI002786CB12|nr:DUF418 domain-containing protein [Microbacterium sp. W4I20]MDQ0729151.1 putative membrane protein YeiB [Microbacterium sp. W4I20]
MVRFARDGEQADSSWSTSRGLWERMRSAAAAEPRGADTAPAARIIGLDLARLLAVLGMVAAHIFLGNAPEVALLAITGFPAALFAVLGGVSAVVSTRSQVHEGRVFAACASVVLRGGILLLIGTLLGLLPNFIVMVLAYYGAALAITGLLLWLPTWLLALGATTLVFISPYAILAVRQATTSEPIAVPVLDSPLSFIQTIGFTGFYPAVTWLTYMLIGVCVGRWLLNAPLTANRTLRGAAVGALIAVAGSASDLASRGLMIDQLRREGSSFDEAQHLLTAEGHGTPLSGGWVALLNAAPHTGSSADILRTAGVGILILTLLVAATASNKQPLRQPLDALARAGAASLTIYVLQYGSVPIMLIVTSLLLQDTEAAPAIQVLTLFAHAVLIAALSWLLSRLNRRGPLEALVSDLVKAFTSRA